MMINFLKTTTGVCMKGLSLLLLFNACSNIAEPVLEIDNEVWKDTLNIGTYDYKVLYLVVDGINGKELRDINGHYLNQLTQTAIFSWDALADYENDTLELATSWTNLMTGISPDVHGVKEDNFLNYDRAQYPSFIQRLEETASDLQSAAFSVSADFSEQLTASADVHELMASDNEVKEALLAELEKPEIDVLLGHMNGPKIAGDEQDYSANTLAYRDAVLLIDSYLGELRNALLSRPTFEYEKWLVVLASSNGGPTGMATHDGVSAFDDPVRNTFMMFYNPRFIANAIPAPLISQPRYEGTAITYKTDENRPVNAFMEGENQLFDFGSEGEYTVDLKVKIPNGEYYYPVILSKRESFNPGVPGWCLFLEGKKWQVNIGIANAPNIQVSGADINDGSWHSLSFVIREEDGSRVLRTYTDGEFNNELDITGLSLSSAAPFTIGPIASGWGGVEYKLTDLKIFSTALSDEIIQKYHTRVESDESHPEFDALTGYWPGLDGSGELLVDQSSQGNDFRIEGDYDWVSFSDVADRFTPPVPVETYRGIPLGVDAPAQIFQWFGIYQLPEHWNIAGKARTYDYNDVNQ